MTLEECYSELHGDYASAKVRLLNDRLIDKFIRKFPADPTMQQLQDAVSRGDRQAAFMAAHTLKGVAANLSFNELQQAASDLTEQLRNQQSDPDPVMVQAVHLAYDRVMVALRQYME